MGQGKSGQVMLGQALNTQKGFGHSDKQGRVFWAREQHKRRKKWWASVKSSYSGDAGVWGVMKEAVMSPHSGQWAALCHSATWTTTCWSSGGWLLEGLAWRFYSHLSLWHLWLPYGPRWGAPYITKVHSSWAIELPVIRAYYLYPTFFSPPFLWSPPCHSHHLVDVKLSNG